MHISPILQMFYGERGNHDTIPFREEYASLLEKVAHYDNNLREKLKETPELLELYQQTTDAIDAMHSNAMDDYFSEGFRFGVLLGMDIMRDGPVDTEPSDIDE